MSLLKGLIHSLQYFVIILGQGLVQALGLLHIGLHVSYGMLPSAKPLDQEGSNLAGLWWDSVGAGDRRDGSGSLDGIGGRCRHVDDVLVGGDR